MARKLLIPGLAGLLLLGACQRSATDTAPPIAPTASAPAAGTAATTAGSCVEQYSVENLKNRDYAFDGTVREIKAVSEDRPDRVIFDVRRWYKGGQATSAVRTAYGFTAVTSAGGSPHRVGDRLLVTGDDDTIWACGFTQPYTASAASDWETAFPS